MLDPVDGVRLLMKDAAGDVLPALGLQHLPARGEAILHLGQRPLQHAGGPEALPVAVAGRALSRKPADEQHLPARGAMQDGPGVALIAEGGAGGERLEIQRIRPGRGERTELLLPQVGRRQAPEELLQIEQLHDERPPWGGRVPEGSTVPVGSSNA